MRYLAVFLFAGLVHGRGGLPARSAPDSYPAQAQGRGFIVAAEVMSPEQVRNEFSTTLTPMYQVLEVAVFPAQGSTVDVIGYCHVGLIPSNAMLNECRLTFTVATGFHEKSSQNASGITFDLA